MNKNSNYLMIATDTKNIFFSFFILKVINLFT